MMGMILLLLVGGFAGNKVLEKRVYDLEDAEHMFRRGDLMENVGNRLFVVDNFASTLYVYRFEKDTLTFVKKAAGPGQGPGDLHFPIALTTRKDKISIKDQQGFSFFDNNGKYLFRFKAKPGWDSFVLLGERIVSTQLRSRHPFLMVVSIWRER